MPSGVLEPESSNVPDYKAIQIRDSYRKLRADMAKNAAAGGEPEDGLRVGDAITHWNGQPLSDISTFRMRAMLAAITDKKTVLTIKRADGEIVQVTIPAAKPE